MGGCRDVRQGQEGLVSRLLNCSNGIPSHDTFGRVFARLDPVQFEECFEEWVHAVNDVTGGQVVAIDGKIRFVSHDGVAGKSAIHMVSAWASVNRLILGQTKAMSGPTRSRPYPNCSVRWTCQDAQSSTRWGEQKDIATTIIDQGADYVLALKENQPQRWSSTTTSMRR